MTNYPFDSLSEFRDVDTLNPVRTAIEEGEIASFEAVADALRANSRDNARTPMQWTAGESAGFTDGDPWIPVNPDHDEVNVAAERGDPDSVLEYYRDLIALREYDVVVYGDYDPLTPDHGSLWVYTRTLGDDRLLVTLNFDDDHTRYDVPDRLAGAAEVLVANYDGVGDPVGEVDLRPWEARVYRLD
jgi:oligo-1,6-glucosidase